MAKNKLTPEQLANVLQQDLQRYSYRVASVTYEDVHGEKVEHRGFNGIELVQKYFPILGLRQKELVDNRFMTFTCEGVISAEESNTGIRVLLKPSRNHPIKYITYGIPDYKTGRYS